LLTLLYQVWPEYRIKWNPSEFGGISTISVKYEDLWTPDTMLYNGQEMYRNNAEDRRNALVQLDEETQNHSWVYFFYNAKYSVGCRFDMRFFPFDQQTCVLTFGTWTYDESKIIYLVNESSATEEHYQSSSAWSLINFTMEAYREKYTYFSRPFVNVKATIVIKRKYAYHLFHLVLPTLIINFISTYALFCSPGIPENRNHKLQIGVASLTSYCILLLSLAEQLPKGSKSIPLLGWFYLIMMVHNSVDSYVAVWLTYPERRKYFVEKFRSTQQVMDLDRSMVSINNINVKILEGNGFSQFRDPAWHESIQKTRKTSDFWGSWTLEDTCFVISIFTTVTINAIMFAVGVYH